MYNQFLKANTQHGVWFGFKPVIFKVKQYDFTKNDKTEEMLRLCSQPS